MIRLVLGEYAGNHGFLLPNPVSILPEYLKLRLQVARCMQLSKNGDTWRKILRHSDVKYDTALRVFKEQWYG